MAKDQLLGIQLVTRQKAKGYCTSFIRQDNEKKVVCRFSYGG
jgi:hypothetical protein